MTLGTPRVLAFLLPVAFGLSLLLGCAEKPKAPIQDNSNEEEVAGWQDSPAAAVELDQAAPQVQAFAMAKAAPRRSMLAGGMRAQSLRPAAPMAYRADGASEAPEPVARMVSQEGDITLRATEPERLLDTALSRVLAWGGYLDSRGAGWARLKVPASRFDTAFQALLRLGDVVDYNRHAEDITADFRDTDLRQKVVAATITRLEALVARASGDLNKLRLLGELKRYREEWESLEAQKKALKKRSDYASITLRVQGRTPGLFAEAEADFPEFAWIHRLDPFHPDLRHGKKLRFHTPSGLVPTSESRVWRATAAEGSEMWARELCPGIRGDSRFWRDAVLGRLQGQFKSADTLEAGGFLFCRFTGYGPRAYAYWIGVRSEGNGVRVVELYFPDESQYHYSATMLDAIKKGPLKWYQRS